MSLTGLTSKQVEKKLSEGKVNHTFSKNNNTIIKIILRNALTIFNLVNLVLAIMIISVGAYKNLLFILIAIANTLISIINEIRAKKIVDKMRLVSEQKPTVIRNGKSQQIEQTSIVEGDLMVLSLGDQVLVDCRIEQGAVEVNEAFITGEQENIAKHRGDHLASGSFVVSGSCQAVVIAVGVNSGLAKIEKTAHSIKTADSKLFTLMNNIVKYISFALIPIGVLLLWSRFRTESDTTIAVTSTVAALINMIPEGLILLTSSVLALATIRLSRRKVLVQDLYAIETLARVDTIALDKTGTLTTGRMVVRDFILPDGSIHKTLSTMPTHQETAFLTVLGSILGHQNTRNATMTALMQKFARDTKTREIKGIIETIDFSSERKHSGVITNDSIYLLGAIDFVTEDKALIAKVKDYSEGYRILAVVQKAKHSKGSTKLLGVIRLEDEIRSTAPAIVKYFYDNHIDIKIISGDDLDSVTAIASRVGIRDLRGFNLSSETTHNYANLVRNYSIFTRVTPAEKKSLIAALRNQGKTLAMTGDGVNDILAMKEADVSLAIGEGSDAARRAAKFVLLDSGFEAIPSIIDEGRQSINNLERSTSLFLAKTVYASILAIVFVVLPFSYPFSPIEMSLLNFACIGFPGLILALEHNTERIKNRFTTNIIEYSLPIGLTVSVCMLALSVISHFQEFSRFELTTTSVFITFIIDLSLIYWISKPLNKLRSALLISIIAIMAAAFLIPFAREFFEFTFLTTNGIIITLVITAIGFLVFNFLRLALHRLSAKILKKI